MSKGPSQKQWRTLKRFALAGRNEEVRHLLEKWRSVYPDDTRVATELKRLNAGEKLLITETRQERTTRCRDEAVTGILALLRRCRGSHIIPSSTTKELLSMRTELRAHLRALKSVEGTAPQGTWELLRVLDGELAKRQHKTTRGRLLRVGIAVMVLAVLGGTFWMLRHRAGTLATRLQEARKHENWAAAEQLLSAVDTGVNHLVNRQVEPIVDDVVRWRQDVLSKSKALAQQMVVYENMDAVSSLSLEERARFLRTIRALPTPFSGKLLAQWDELCRPVREILEKQKREAIIRFSAPFPEPEISGDVESDIPVLRRAARALSRLIEDFQDAREALDLDEEVIARQRQLLHQMQQSLTDLEQLSRTVMLLRTARSLREHRQVLRDFHPISYPQAVRAAKIREILDEKGERVHAMILGMRYRVPVALPFPYPPHVMSAIIEGGPTFSPQAPASAAQVALMEDIFTGRTLRQKLYELTAPGGKVRYSERPPDVTGDGHVQFEVSTLDPSYRLEEQKEDWLYPQMVKMRTVDATPVLKVTGIERPTFFSRANVPKMLGQITCVRQESCPALAKAYVYGTLVKLLSLNRDKDVLGLRFSPSLTTDIESFGKLVEKSRFTLSPSCWLQASPASANAEAAFADWFSEHSNRRYDREMYFNLRAIINTKPQYVGFVDLDGTLRFKETLVPAPNRTLYYFSGSELKASPASAPPTAPTALSPIFSL